MSDNERRTALIQGLRECADFLEAHPLVPLPRFTTLNAFPLGGKDEMAQIARHGNWRKEWAGDWLMLRKTFGDDLKLDVGIPRETICRKVVTGERVIPATSERTVETFEWVCEEPSLLAEAGK